MRIPLAIQILALVGAVACSPSEPTVDPEATSDPATETNATTTETEIDQNDPEQVADAPKKPEVRYYLLSEQ